MLLHGTGQQDYVLKAVCFTLMFIVYPFLVSQGWAHLRPVVKQMINSSRFRFRWTVRDHHY